jgi:hypothetical protein
MHGETVKHVRYISVLPVNIMLKLKIQMLILFQVICLHFQLISFPSCSSLWNFKFLIQINVMTNDRSRAFYSHVVNNFKIRYENCGLSSSISCRILKVLVGKRLSYLEYRTLSFGPSRPMSGYEFKLSLETCRSGFFVNILNVLHILTTNTE